MKQQIRMALRWIIWHVSWADVEDVFLLHAGRRCDGDVRILSWEDFYQLDQYVQI